jgi:hypothetical protein
MRTIGVKSNHMLRNVIGQKMNNRINTIGNKIIPYYTGSMPLFPQPMPDIYTSNPNMDNLINMRQGIKNLSISNKKNLYEKRKKK